MDPLSLGAAAIALMLVLVAAGIPVAFSMGLVALGGLWLVGGDRMMFGTLRTLPYSVSSEYAFVVIPMFVLMGALASASGATADLYAAFYRLFCRVRGSLYMVTTLSSAGFAAISGSTIVNAAVFTRIALPQMLRFGYDGSLAAGCIAAAGTFAALIPPSIMMVIYALLTGESIGRLFMAGVLPGLLTAFMYVVGIAVYIRFRPHLAPEPTEQFTTRQKLESLGRVWPFALLVVVVLGGIYSGAMFPSSAGAVGATGAFLIAVARGRLSGKSFADCLRDAAVTTTVLFLLIVSGLIFSRFLVFSGFITEITSFIQAQGISIYVVMALIIVMYIVLGMFIDTVSVTVVTIPFVYPIIVNLGMDPIWFGVIVIKLIEISAITPPVGLNLYAVLTSAEKRVNAGQLFRGVVPFLFIEMVVLAILILFPAISLWLPNRMMGG